MPSRKDHAMPPELDDSRSPRTRQGRRLRGKAVRRETKGYALTTYDDADGKGATTSIGSRVAGSLKDPAAFIGGAISDALDPSQAPGKVKTFRDMTPEEREAMRRLYEKKP